MRRGCCCGPGKPPVGLGLWWPLLLLGSGWDRSVLIRSTMVFLNFLKAEKPLAAAEVVAGPPKSRKEEDANVGLGGLVRSSSSTWQWAGRQVQMQEGKERRAA